MEKVSWDTLFFCPPWRASAARGLVRLTLSAGADCQDESSRRWQRPGGRQSLRILDRSRTNLFNIISGKFSHLKQQFQSLKTYKRHEKCSYSNYFVNYVRFSHCSSRVRNPAHRHIYCLGP